MARIRSLKPTFFTDEEVAALPPLHRMAYQGLWCHADREGRMEDKPRELKIKILPFDDVDFETILRDLSRPRADGRGFITRYQVGAKRYIAIPKFSTHQKPHPKEPKSDIPGPNIVEPGKKTAEQDSAAAKHVPTSGEPGGVLVLGSGFLVREPEPGKNTATRTPLEEAFVAPPPDRRAQPPPPKLETPPKPPAAKERPSRGLSDAEQWYAQRQQEREALGWASENPPNPKELNGWYAGAVKEFGLPALGDAWDAYLRDKHWTTKRCPWAGWIYKYRELVPAREVGPPPKACAVPGCGRVAESSAPDETPACYGCLTDWRVRWEADGSPQYPETGPHYRAWVAAREREAA